MKFWNGIKLLGPFRAAAVCHGDVLSHRSGDSGVVRDAVFALVLALLFAMVQFQAVRPAFAGSGAPSSPEGESVGDSVARVVAIDLTQDADAARLVLTLSAPVEARAFLLERPDRVIVDLPQVTFNLPAEELEGTPTQKAKALVASYRYGLFARGRSRVVIDLNEPALATKVFSEAAIHGATLTIELKRTDRKTYSRTAMQPMVEAAAALSRAENARAAEARASAGESVEKRGDLPLIVLDPGHGGVDPGAIRFGVQEKDLVFAFAERFRDQIEATGRYRVQLTRTDDTFVSLGGRVRIAREAGADLFISIHADSLGRNGTVRGATIYTSSNTPTDAESAQLAAKENLADQIAGVEVTEETDDVVGILADLTRRETKSLSSFFADKTIDALRQQVYLTRNPHRSAGFRVLKAPDVPSVLLELGYLSSTQDVELLTSEEWQMKTISAMIKALDRFFAPRIAEQRVDKG